MQKQKLTSNHPFMLGRSILSDQKTIACRLKKIKITSIRSTAMRLLVRTKKRLNSITPFPLMNFRLRFPKSVKKVGKQAL